MLLSFVDDEILLELGVDRLTDRHAILAAIDTARAVTSSAPPSGSPQAKVPAVSAAELGEKPKHALLSPSAASRWMACTPSAQLEWQIPSQTSSFAAEGTFAHEVAANQLALWNAERSGTESEARAAADCLLELAHDPHYSDVLRDYIGSYVDYCKSVVETGGSAARCYIETKVSMEPVVPGAYGTADFVALTRADTDGPAHLHIVDLKYGKGVRVGAAGNVQLKLYAVGAVNLIGPEVRFFAMIPASLAK